MDDKTLRGLGIADAASDAATQPPYAEIAGRGASRLRRRRSLSGVVGAVAAVAVIAAGVSVLSGDGDPRVDAPAQSPTPSPPEATSSTPTPQEGVDPVGPAKAMVYGEHSAPGVVAIDSETGATAALWNCLEQCAGTRHALVVLDEGRRAVFPLAEGGNVAAAGSGTFVFGSWEPGADPRLFSVDGEIDVRMAEEAPLQMGEALVPIFGSGRPFLGFVAVDGAAANAHPVPMPDGWLQSVPIVVGQQLTVVAGEPAQVWTSTDGGASWSASDAELDGYLPHVVDSRSEGTQTVLLGGDGATLFPVQRVVQVRPDGTSSDVEVQGETVFLEGALVRDDGQIVLVTQAGERGDPCLVQLLDPSTGALSAFDAEHSIGTNLCGRGTVSTSDGPMLSVTTDDRGVSLVSADGESWREVALR